MAVVSCARNLAGPEEDCGWRVTYVPCGKPATATVLGGRFFDDVEMCELHAAEAEQEGFTVERGES